jgi:hypothetical protein
MYIAQLRARALVSTRIIVAQLVGAASSTYLGIPINLYKLNPKLSF